MSILKNNIQNFLNSNSDKKFSVQRFIQETDAVNFPSLFDEFSENNEQVFFFSNPTEEFEFLSINRLVTRNTKRNFSDISNNSQSLPNCIAYNSKPPENINIPLFIGSKKFKADIKESLWKDFDDEDWFIPRIILLKKNSSFYLIINFIHEDSDLSFLDKFEKIFAIKANEKQKFNSGKRRALGDFEEWHSKIKNYLTAIKNGIIEKAVLARRIVIDIENFSVSSSLQKLKSEYPGCYTFAYKKNNSVFLGATPEKLFSINNSLIKTEAIAGSAPRGVDSTEDSFIEKKLLNTPKELHEHQNVVEFIRENLEPFVTNLTINHKLSIKKLNNIQHILTPISANVKEGINILEIVNSLHPTPAVCGVPRVEAFKLIEEEEDFDRGLYSGIIGWFNEKQNGEFVVGIRSALYTNNKLYAYAGCGIVEGSDPNSEFNETELKLKPILSLLDNETKS